LQSSTNSQKTAEVSQILEELSAKWVEDIVVGKPSYSLLYDEENRLLASLSIGSATQSLDVLLAWEDASPEKEQQQNARPSQSAGGSEEQQEDAWRYYDIQQTDPAGNRSRWNDSIPEAIAAFEAFRVKLERAAQAQEDEGEDGHQDADDYWGGVSDSDDGEDQPVPSRAVLEEDYWAEYDQKGSTIEEEPEETQYPSVQPPHLSTSDATNSAPPSIPVALSASDSPVQPSPPKDDLNQATRLAIQGIWRLYSGQIGDSEIQRRQQDFLDIVREVIESPP
jgi:hypothetical protein